MRDIGGADFRFAKTLTLPFFGSGMVDLPPGGTKRIKNSRKMQMVFFVFYGRVLVELGTPTQRFSIGRGGMWQVPRGELPCFRRCCCSQIGFAIIAPSSFLAMLDPAGLEKEAGNSISRRSFLRSYRHSLLFAVFTAAAFAFLLLLWI